MRLMIALLPLVLAPAPRQDPTTPDAQAPAPPSYEEVLPFLFHAVLEGLYTDGVKDDVVDALMASDEATGWPLYFIFACPICMPAWDAFATYRTRPTFLVSKQRRDNFGEGLDERTRAALLAGSVPARMQALRALVQRWVGQRLDLMRLSGEERAGWLSLLEALREKGLAYLKSYRGEERFAHLYRELEFCAFCEGASAPEHR